MRSSEQLDQLATALAKAQGMMSNATLNKTNPHFKSRYADLAAIREAVTLPLASNGLAVVQLVGSDENGAFLTTRMVHTSGQWVESAHPLPASAKPQEFGSALTYARRYSLAAMCGISAEEDDDANGASEPMQTARPQARTAAPQSKTAASPAEEWAGKQTITIRTLSSVSAVDEWIKKNEAHLARLEKAAPEAAAKLDDLLAETRQKARNYGLAAE